jgi:DNA-binding transcriptional MerR regulator
MHLPRKICKIYTRIKITCHIKVNFGHEHRSHVIDIMNNKNVSIRTIRQILQTTGPGQSRFLVACAHEKAQVEDLLAITNEYRDSLTAVKRDKGLRDDQLIQPHIFYNKLVDNLFTNKRKQLDIYLKKTYEVDTTQMLESQIKEMLELY